MVMATCSSFVIVGVFKWELPVGMVKIISIQEPCPLKQVFTLINFIMPLTLIISFMALTRGWALKLPIIIKLSYAQEKKSIIPSKILGIV